MSWFSDAFDFVEDIGQDIIDIATDPIEETTKAAGALASGDFSWDWSNMFAGNILGHFGMPGANAVGSLLGTVFGAQPRSGSSSGGSGGGEEGGSYPSFGGGPGIDYASLLSQLTSSPEIPEVPEAPTLVDAATNAKLLLRDAPIGRLSTLLTGGQGSTGTTQRRALSARETAPNAGDTLGRQPLTSLLG